MPRLSRTLLLPVAAVLALVAAAGAQATKAEVDVGSGLRFLPEVADPLNDSGRYASVVVNDAGLPVVAYLAFEEVPEEGELVQPRPVGAPSIPGVMLATVSEQGYWTMGAIAIAAQIPNVEVPFAPAFEPSVADLTPDTVTGLQLVADGETYHAVWGSADGVYHATGSLDPSSTSQAQVTRVTSTPGLGPSIGLVGDEPWIAYQTSTSTTARLELAVPEGDGWSLATIATEAPGCETCSTAVVETDAGPVVTYSTGGEEVSVATHDIEGGWGSFELVPGGRGLSGTAIDGSLALSFYGAGQVSLLRGGPGSFEISTVAEVPDGSDSAEGARTAVAAGADGSVTVAWRDAEAGVRVASGGADALEPIDTGGATGEGAFPAAAAAPDGPMYVAWYDAGEEDVLVGGYGEFGEVGFAVPSPTPTGTIEPPAPPSDECTPVEGGTVTVVAQGTAFTEGRCVEAPAGEPFTIAFDNRDANTQHNVQIFAGEEPSGETLFEGDLVTGPAQIDFEVPALDAGTYAYICIVHPQMQGEVRATEGGGGDGGGGGGAGTTVTAASLAFDTSEIALATGEPTTITFVNDDAGAQHNIAIYPSADDLANPLFRGELVTGPDEIEYAIDPLEAGEYYFRCDVHPDMNGTVVVS